MRKVCQTSAPTDVQIKGRATHSLSHVNTWVVMSGPTDTEEAGAVMGELGIQCGEKRGNTLVPG